MDGIDGIAGLQSVIAGMAWCVGGTMMSAPLVALVGATLAAGGLGFLRLNWPPATIFMGDSASTVLGYCFAVLPLLLVVETRDAAHFERTLLGSALVLWPFLADGSFTVLRRLKNGGNIFQAHRTFLIHRLAIAGVSHRRVTCVYGLLAGLGVMLAWRLAVDSPFAIVMSVVVPGIAFMFLWLWVVRCETLVNAGVAGR